MHSAHRRVHSCMHSLTLRQLNTFIYKQNPHAQRLFRQTQVHGLSTIKPACCIWICPNMLPLLILWILQSAWSSGHEAIRMQPAESSRFLLNHCWVWFLDPQGFRAARFPQLLRAALMICYPPSDCPKALIRISIPAAPGAWAGHPLIPRARLLGYNTEI